MDISKYSRTALMSAFVRDYHYQNDQLKIFDDHCAELFLSPVDKEWIEESLLALSGNFTDEELGHAKPANKKNKLLNFFHGYSPFAEILARSRYTEDYVLEAIKRGVKQYVVIGAGFETFAFRYKNFEKELQIFEIDHPATQKFKQEALLKKGIQKPENLHFIAADLELTPPGEVLKETQFCSSNPSVISWLGVAPYLTKEAFKNTLHSIRKSMAPESKLIFNYLDKDTFLADKADSSVYRLVQMTRNLGEPLITGFDEVEIVDLLQKENFTRIEDIDPEQQNNIYFKNNKEGYSAMPHSHFVCATV